jgi:long-chain acyl-CoA synthetase
MAVFRSGDRVTNLSMRNAARAATGFQALGVGRQDVIALVLRNDFAFFEASLAAGYIGAYPTPVNWHATAPEADYVFKDSGAKAIVIHADLLPGLRGVIPPNTPILVVETPPEIAAAYGVDQALCAVPSGETGWCSWLSAQPPFANPPADNPGSIIYTSGTTGHPKGVRRFPPTPQQYAAFQTLLAGGFGLSLAKDNPEEIVTVVAGPMYHSAPNAYGLLVGRMGGNVILQPRFDAEELLQLIERHKVTHLHMVPIMFNRLLKLPEEVRSRYDTSSLRYVIHAAAPVSPPIKRAMIEWWGPVIFEYFGSTETGMVTHLDSHEWLAHPGSVGKVCDGCEVRILDEAGNSLGPGEIGEVVAINHAIHDFTYHGDDDKRQKSQRNGLITPGDVGYLDADGYLFLCDRAKDMIISGGANIYPAEIEAALHKMPGVADCAVFGVPDEEYGEAVHAVVQPQPGVTLTQADVRSYLRSQIAGMKVPKTVDFASDLPREDSGKIFKRKLREPFWAGHERRI